MEFARPRPRRRAEPILAMINVVFLLLIFFLITARIAPAPPFEIAPPEIAEAGEGPGASETLYVAADGGLAYGDARGEAVFAALGRGNAARLTIRADGALPAADLARLIARLAELGRDDVQLEVLRR